MPEHDLQSIVFKCEASLWQMLADGSKAFDMRRWDLTDERIGHLAWFQRNDKGEHTPVVANVSFENKATAEILTFSYKDIQFAEWAPGWCFILLGERQAAGCQAEEVHYEPDSSIWPDREFQNLGELGEFAFKHFKVQMMHILRVAGKLSTRELTIRDAKAAVERILRERPKAEDGLIHGAN